MKKTNNTQTPLAIALLSVSLTASVNSDEFVNDSDDVFELPAAVVTGDLWQSDLLETSASVTLLDSDSLQTPGFEHFDDLTAYLPNLTTTGGTSRSRYFQLRGIGENSQFEGETPDSAVVYLMDDFDLTGVGTVGSLFDVQQVEVLRGPQAGAFGANAAGGLIRIVSADPTPYWTGYAQTTVGEDSLFGGEFAVGGPLSEANPEKLTMRFSMMTQGSDGFYENRTLDRPTNEREESAARLKLRWKEDAFQWDASLLYANSDNGYDQFAMTNEEYVTYSDEPGRDEQESLGLSLKGLYELQDGQQFTSKTSFVQTDSLYSYDADWTDASYAGYLETNRDREVVSQELRFDSSMDNANRWTVGLYYQQLEEDSDVLYRDGDPSGGEWYFGQVDVYSVFKTETLAVFGQMDFQLAERTRLVAGLRFEDYDVSFDSQSDEMGYYQGYLYDGNRDNDDSLFGGKLSLEQDLSDSLMGFASLVKGYKAGGANSGTFTTPDMPALYDTETLWNFEAGLRGRWLDNRLTGQVTAFYLEREDTQLRDSVGAGGFFRYLTVNGDGATHSGVEAEIKWWINDEWTLDAGIGFLDAERDSYTDPSGLVPARELANAPSYTYNLRLSYNSPEGLFGSFSIAGRDSYFESNSHTQERDAMTVANASIGYRLEDWTFALWAKNLSDERYASRVFYFDNGEGDMRYEAMAAPRQIGATVRYDF
ncbi:TonB-dependent receptor [Pelagicoccus albus]|uniref:TonB-dependent receptor n=1 Tax=Pelagicoccus albus TaxID=415222 RepID=A0A7X1B8Y4_9BACT|nr:TonB-dependent receptor [Pelagicoccus albus]MBC2607539.1 TonB-dependent receptor [Pelagicoccus albus]